VPASAAEAAPSPAPGSVPAQTVPVQGDRP